MRVIGLCLVLIVYICCFDSCTRIDDNLDKEDVDLFQPSDSILLKPNLRVLDLGNSYTNDATAYLPFLVEALGVELRDMCLFKVVLGGSSFKSWYNVYYDKNGISYVFSKVVGELDANVEPGIGEEYDGSLLRKILKEETWDIIIIHPLGRYATDDDKWWGHSDAGYLKELLDIIKNFQPDCTIGFMLVHSPDDEYYTNAEQSSLLRWEKIALATQRFVQECKINVLIPYGTAIQNLRATDLNNDAELTRDGAHLGQGLARYTAACCYYEALLAHRTGVSILGKNIPYEVAEKPEISQYRVFSDNMEIAQKAAVLACKEPFKCNDPDVIVME